MVQLSRGGGARALSRETPAAPSYDEVAVFHTNADIDSSTAAVHHTAGSAANQASPGDHVHDGGSSSPLLQGLVVSGVRGTSAYYQSLENALAKVGANITATG